MLDCARQFKVVTEVLTSCLGGPIELKKNVKDHPDYVEGRQALTNQLTIAADERLATCLCLASSDQDKHVTCLS